MADELERLDTLLATQDARVRRSFLRYVELVNSDVVMALVLEQLEAHEYDRAFAILETYIGQMGDVLPEVQLDVGRETAEELQGIVSNAAVAISFDATHPRAAELVRTQRLNLIVGFRESQLRSVQQAVNRGISTGAGAVKIARAFRSAVGLTMAQEAAVQSYRRVLETRPQDALGRALRDRRLDGQIIRSIEAEAPLSTQQINLMVSRYRQRSIMARADTISRTEAHRAYSEARLEALEQMSEQTGISAERIIREWNRTKDERTRDWHDTMQGQTTTLGGTFTDGHGNTLRYPGDPEAPAETVISCRCTETYRIAAAA